uniref:Pre-B-cell leukemia homeobox interacting protein 1b n=2 Tax=Iconisemion striatum TaxID=60296 RepID=A0A1A7XBU5_9TELE
MSAASGTNNSWTILTSEESVAETLRPFAAAAEQHDLNQTPAPGSGGNHQPDRDAASAEGLPVEDCLASEDTRADSGSDQHSSVPPSPKVPSTLDHGDGVGPAEGRTETPEQSESHTLLPPSPDQAPPGGAELTGEKLTQVENLHQQSEEEFQQKGEESAHHPLTDETGAKGEPEERRKKSLLAAVEQIGRREEEEEEEEEEFHLPQQENSSIFSLNKCILGAVILLGFGTIFFSENDHATMELKDAESPGKREWFNPDADTSELLNKLAEGSQQISALQAQLQAQKEELKVVKEQAAEGEKERLLWEEVEKENSRLKTEMASLPVLQKENDRMKEELESVPALQKELETLRSTVTKFKRPSGDLSSSTMPPTGRPEDSSQVTTPPTDGQTRKTRDDRKEEKESKLGKREAKQEKKQSKERERSDRKKGEQKEDKHGDEKEWKEGKREGGTFDKEKEKAGKQKRHSDERKEGKKERGEDGKPWKDKEGKKEWKKGKQGKVNEEWRGKEEKKHQGRMSHGERHKGREEWKGEVEWTKMDDGMEESGREKWERKDWKEKGEKEWKKEKKDHHKEGRGKSERKQWEEGRSYDRERTGKEERKQDEERKKRDENLSRWEKEEWKRGGEKERRHNGDKSHSSLNRKEHLYGEKKPSHSHPRPSVGQPEYWLQRRDRLRLRRRPTPPQHCRSPESCAQAERLLPVSLLEFQNLLQPYLTKAEEVGADGSRTDELRKLAAEFFTDGVFVHDQMSFRDFVEELGDVLEDLVEGDDEEDSDVEDEMEEFEKEVLKTFLVPGAKEKERRMKEESRQERG